MPKKKEDLSPVKPTFLTGKEKTKTVEIKKSAEFWSIYTLADGTKVKIKPVVAFVKKIIGKYNHIGDPIYQLQAGVAVDVEVPKKLKKKQKAKS